MSYEQCRRYDELVREGSNIYVVNNTEPRSLYIATETNPINGRALKLEFPRTWIPLCLTDMVPRETLERGTVIRGLIQRQVLRLVEEDDAEKILESPEGQREYNRLHVSSMAKGSGMTAQKQALMDSQRRGDQDNTSSRVQEAKGEEEPAPLSLHPKVKGWEDLVSIGNLDGPSLMSEIRMHEGEFTSQDVQYLLTASFPREVKDWASKRMEQGGLREESLAKPIPDENAPTKDPGYEADWE